VFGTFGGLFGIAAVGIGNYQKYTIRLITVTSLSLLLWLVVVKWGLAAVAYGAVIYSVLSLFIAVGIVREKIQLSWKDVISCIAPALISSLLMLICVEGVYLFFITTYRVMNLIAVIAVGAAVYLIAIAKFPSSLLDSIRTSMIHDISASWGKFKYACKSTLSFHE
jgi:hypothetical protein